MGPAVEEPGPEGPRGPIRPARPTRPARLVGLARPTDPDDFSRLTVSWTSCLCFKTFRFQIDS